MAGRAVLEIREATSADGEALSTLDAATWDPDVTPAPPHDPGKEFFGDRTDPADVLVAESEGAVVGYLSLHQTIPLESHRHVLEINGLAVDPERQGHGVGRALVEAAKAEARRRGARKLSLRVLQPNASARRLYAACGFVEEGVLRGEFVLRGRPVDDILMAYHLDRDPA